jgi:8-oxo-dGTP pyrophosphatase MutT (NUDIX family)
MATYQHIKSCFSSTDVPPRRVQSIPGYAQAGVLVPLVFRNDACELLFTKRTESVETHKGQISFPGGMVDAADPDIEHTALREANEEIGLPSSHIEIVGLLDDMATPSGFVITPVVGVIADLPHLKLNTDEVAEVFSVALDFFSRPSSGRTERREFRGRTHEVWFYDWNDRIIWGATAMMIRSLLKRLRLI